MTKKLIFTSLVLTVFRIATAQQEIPILKGDSAYYQNTVHPKTWYNGFIQGREDKSDNNYSIRISQNKYYHYASIDTLSTPWYLGYTEGYHTGGYQTNAYTHRAKIKSDSIDYNGKKVSNKWYYNTLEYQTYFMPGLSYTMLFPKDKDSLGTLQGIGVEYLLYAKVNKDDNSGPSHARVYGRMSVLKSTNQTVLNIFSSSIGIDLSIEKNPQRNILVPYFGVEATELYSKQIRYVTILSPLVGLHILSKKNIFAGAHIAYMYPFKDVETMRGYTINTSINIALW